MKKYKFDFVLSIFTGLAGIMSIIMLALIIMNRGELAPLEMMPLLAPLFFFFIYGCFYFIIFGEKWSLKNKVPKACYLISFLLFGFYTFGILRTYSGTSFVDEPQTLAIVRMACAVVIGSLSALFGALSFSDRYIDVYGNRKSGILAVLSSTIMFGIFYNACVQAHFFFSSGVEAYDYMVFEIAVLVFSLGGIAIGFTSLLFITRLKGNMKKYLNISLIGYLLYIPAIAFMTYNIVITSAVNAGDIFLILCMLISFALNRFAYTDAPQEELPKREEPILYEDSSNDEEDEEDYDDEDYDYEEVDEFLECYEKLIKLKELLDKGIMDVSEYLEMATPIKEELKDEASYEEEDYFESVEEAKEEYQEDFDNAIDRLIKLKELFDMGILLKEEYQEMSNCYKNILKENTSYEDDEEDEGEDEEDEDDVDFWFQVFTSELVKLKDIYDKSILTDEE
jgi:uncharacterized protein YqgQ